MPPKTRALFTSSTAWEKLGNDRRTPGSFSESTENGVLSPKFAAKIPAAAALTVECPEGYSGKFGMIPGDSLQQGYPRRVGNCRRIAIETRQNDRGDGPPEYVEVFRIPAGD